MGIKESLIVAVQQGQMALDQNIFELKKRINNIEYLKVLVVLSKQVNDIYIQTASIDGVEMFLNDIEPYLLDNEKISEFIMNAKGDFTEVENEIYHFFDNNFTYEYKSGGNSQTSSKAKAKVLQLTNGHNLLDETGDMVLVRRENQKVLQKNIGVDKAGIVHPIILGAITAVIEIITVAVILMK